MEQPTPTLSAVPAPIKAICVSADQLECTEALKRVPPVTPPGPGLDTHAFRREELRRVAEYVPGANLNTIGAYMKHHYSLSAHQDRTATATLREVRRKHPSLPVIQERGRKNKKEETALAPAPVVHQAVSVTPIPVRQLMHAMGSNQTFVPGTGRAMDDIGATAPAFLRALQANRGVIDSTFFDEESNTFRIQFVGGLAPWIIGA